VSNWGNPTGRIALVDGQDGLRPARVAGVEGDKYLRVAFREKAREGPPVKLGVDRVRFVLEGRATTAIEAEAYVDKLGERGKAIDMESVWDLCASEARLDWGTFASLGLGDDDAESRDACVWAVFEDGIYFRVEAGKPTPEPRASVEGRRRERKEREERRARIAAWADAFAKASDARALRGDLGDSALAPRPLSGVASEAATLLEELTLLDAEAPRRDLAADLVRRIAPTDTRLSARVALDLLIGAGHYGTHEDLNLRRARLPRPHAPELLIEAAAMTPLRELENLHTPNLVTIDDASTREIDDAVEAWPAEAAGHIHVRVAIADPALFVPVGSQVDEEAAARGATLYHPVARMPMLPPVISEDRASLVEGELRPAVVFEAIVTPAGGTLEFTMHEAMVRIARRMSYDEADRVLGGDTAWGTPDLRRSLALVKQAADAHMAARIAAGAWIIARDEVKLHVDDHGEVTLTQIPGESPSRQLVQEMMVLACHLAAQHARTHRIPVVYRAQAAAEGVKTTGGVITDPLAAHRTLRGLKRSELTTTPGLHATLGLECYTQVTSPLRRYQDLIVHRQLIAHARSGVAALSETELLSAYSGFEATVNAYRTYERESRRYWTLVWAARNLIGERIDAVVVRELERGGRVLVDLPRLAQQAALSPKSRLEPGQWLSVVVRSVAPRDDALVLEEG